MVPLETYNPVKSGCCPILDAGYSNLVLVEICLSPVKFLTKFQTYCCVCRSIIYLFVIQLCVFLFNITAQCTGAYPAVSADVYDILF